MDSLSLDNTYSAFATDHAQLQRQYGCFTSGTSWKQERYIDSTVVSNIDPFTYLKL